MLNFQTWRSLLTFRSVLLGLLLAYAVGGTLIRLVIPAPDAVALTGDLHIGENVQFFQDDSWIDGNGERQLHQSVFDAVLNLISQAQNLVVVDMFLFNAWQGPVPETERALSSELTQALITRKQAVPDLQIVFISDPINTVYGGLRSEHINALRKAGIPVVLTRLESLQDSNPLWSGLWRFFIAPWGNSEGTILPNPFGAGRVSARSYLALLNFKANHRKLIIADNGDGLLQAMVSSANPHDGSSAHRNVALQFAGAAAVDLLAGEFALLRMSDACKAIEIVEVALSTLGISLPEHASMKRSANVKAIPEYDTSVRVISESRIHDTVIELLADVQAGEAVELAMFYLSDRQIIRELIAAHQRGAVVRVLLDVNSDAFGRAKNGVPNRPVAAELANAGVNVRWCATLGEQCHAKWLHVSDGQSHAFVLGSANFTRRNLHDFNMETNVLVRTASSNTLASEMQHFFNAQWNNDDGRSSSLDYAAFADNSLWLTLQYRFMEATGLSTF